MTNVVRIKRRTTAGALGPPSSLRSGELAYNEKDGSLYYGYGDDGSENAVSIRKIGGTSGFGLELISGSGAFASAAQKDFTNLANYRDLYCTYRIAVATDNSDPSVRFSTDNGSTFLAGATEYNNFRVISVAGSITTSVVSTNAFHLDGAQGVGNLGTEGIQGYFNIFRLTDTNTIPRKLIGSSFFRLASGAGCRADISGDTTTVTACNSIRFISSSGNISGFINLWGIRPND